MKQLRLCCSPSVHVCAAHPSPHHSPSTNKIRKSSRLRRFIVLHTQLFTACIFNLIISAGAERNNNNKTINGNESKWWQWIRTTMIAKHSKYAAKGGIFNHHVCSVFRRIYPSTTNQNNNKIIIADALFQIQQHALQRIKYTMTCNNQPLF